MSKSNAFENAGLALIFHGTAIADLAENDGSSPATNLFLSLHTGDPGEAGDQTTNECAYTAYAREAIARNSGGFTISGNQVTLAAGTIDFADGQSGDSETATHWGLGKSASGAGLLLYKGAISPTIAIANGLTPRITGITITED